MKIKWKLCVAIVVEVLLLIITWQCVDIGWSVYFGDALKGTYEYGIGLLLFAWIPGLVGLALIPVNVLVVVMIVRWWKR